MDGVFSVINRDLDMMTCDGSSPRRPDSGSRILAHELGHILSVGQSSLSGDNATLMSNCAPVECPGGAQFEESMTDISNECLQAWKNGDRLRQTKECCYTEKRGVRGPNNWVKMK